MLRGAIVLIILLILGFSAALFLPFLLSALYIDQRGIIIPAKVHLKREDVLVSRDIPRLETQVTFEYAKPDGSGTAFLKASLAPLKYDQLHVGQTVSLHYLRQQDVPAVPFAQAFRHMQLLPTVRLADQRLFDDMNSTASDQEKRVFTLSVAGVLLIVVWRVMRLPAFAWIAGAAFIALVAAATILDFPRPMPVPVAGLRHSIGRIKSVRKLTRALQGRKSIGFELAQPIDIVGVEFTPEGRTDPVVAMDLVDDGSLPGLREQARLPVEYEFATPRTAYLEGASRNFSSRNIAGIAFRFLIVAVVLGGALFIYSLFGRGYRKLTRQN